MTKFNKKSQSGFTMIELVMVMLMITIIAGVTSDMFVAGQDSIRYEKTKIKLEMLRKAIIGDDEQNEQGERIHFGYFGDNGTMPATLTSLYTNPGYAVWAMQPEFGFGVGWRGPYVTSAITGDYAYNYDEWGTALVYSIAGNPATITSYGADRAAGGTGLSTDLVVSMPTASRLATIYGTLFEKGSVLTSKTLRMHYPSAGAMTQATTVTDALGKYSLTSVPFGVRRLVVGGVGSANVVIDRSSMTIPYTALNSDITQEAVTQSGTANCRGGSSAGVSCNVVTANFQNNRTKDLVLSYVTIGWNSSVIKLLTFTANGIQQQLAAVGQNTRTALTKKIIIPASGISTFEMTFSDSVRSLPISILFEWGNGEGRTDVARLAHAPSWSETSWTAMTTTGAPAARYGHSTAWTGSKLIVYQGYTGVTVNTGGVYDPATDSWTTMSTTGAPVPSYESAIVWTGSRMFAWGGTLDENNNLLATYGGGQYDPVNNVWTAVTTLGAPNFANGCTAPGYTTGCGGFKAVTGLVLNKVIIYNSAGYPNSTNNLGYIYDPQIDSWSRMTTTGAPVARWAPCGVSMGDKLIFWGGMENPIYVNTGYLYNPVLDSWSAMTTTNAPIGRWDSACIWIGNKMFVFGGHYNDGANVITNTGGLYDPTSNTWTASTTLNAPPGRYGLAPGNKTIGWTGKYVGIWGGYSGGGYMNTGGLYNPATDTWIVMNTTGAPAPTQQQYGALIWSGTKFIAWGGYRVPPTASTNTGYFFTPPSF